MARLYQAMYSFRRWASVFFKQRETKSKRITGYPIKEVDGIFLYKRIRKQQDAQALQQDLTNLQEWEKTWEMSFNPSKCEVICITRNRTPVNTTYLIHDHPLQLVKQGKYRGVILSGKLSWIPHIEMVTKRRTTHLLFFVETFPDVLGQMLWFAPTSNKQALHGTPTS